MPTRGIHAAEPSSLTPPPPPQAAISRLRAYRPPPFPLWDALPVRRRAAVLVLLYADRWGDLRVVITMRAASLRSFSGHAALPGGKADSADETPCTPARPMPQRPPCAPSFSTDAPSPPPRPDRAARGL